jgi:dTDP-glucose 4,6-dehydratase/UDP-glucuronate decarboxylase
MSRFNSVIQEDIEIILADLGEKLEALAGTTLLVTGGSGFLCSYFLDTVAALNDRGLSPRCRLIAIDNFKTGLPERIAHLSGRPDIQFIQHDVSQPLPYAGEMGVDWIIHGAGIASPTFYRRYPLETIDVNVSGTRHMLELARREGVRSMLYFSTSEIYGDPDPQAIPTPEDYRGFVSCVGPRACYDESKRLAETLCYTYHALYGTPVKWVRPFNVYGPGQRIDDRRIIPDLMAAALERRPIVLYSDGRATRTFCYIRDAIRACWHILLSEANGEVFNVGNDQGEISIGDLALLMREVAGPPYLEVRYEINADQHYTTDNPQRRCPDVTRLRTRFPWQPEVSLSEGLARTLRSYQEILAREVA